MKIEQDIDICEFEWWTSFIGHLILLTLSIIFIYLWFYLHRLVSEHNLWHLNVLLIPPFMYALFRFPNLVFLFCVPKLIIFKENVVVIVSPMNNKKTFSYNEISRLIVYHVPKWSEPAKWISSSFRARLYFSNGTVKVAFDPSLLSYYSMLLDTFHKKGLDHLIEQK